VFPIVGGNFHMSKQETMIPEDNSIIGPVLIICLTIFVGTLFWLIPDAPEVPTYWEDDYMCARYTAVEMHTAKNCKVDACEDIQGSEEQYGVQLTKCSCRKGGKVIYFTRYCQERIPLERFNNQEELSTYKLAPDLFNDTEEYMDYLSYTMPRGEEETSED
jgi:hypothetical protein